MKKTKTRVWRAFCREGDGGTDYAQLAVSGGFLAFGGSKSGSVEDFSSREAFIDAYTRHYGDGDTRAGQVWRLHQEHGAGDWVLMGERAQRRVHIGRFTDRGYDFVPDDPVCRFAHRFGVEWIADVSYEQARRVCGTGVIGRLALSRLNVDPQLVDDMSRGVTRTFPLRAQTVVGRDLPLKDDSDVKSVAAGGEREVRRRHNAMTNALKKLCGDDVRLREGSVSTCMFDALLVSDQEGGRDLLIEVKSSTERGVLRLAVGQLLDYRRGVERPDETDLAVLLPEKPEDDALAFLESVGVDALWFVGEGMERVEGTRQLGLTVEK